MKTVIDEAHQGDVLAQWGGARAKVWLFQSTHSKMAIMLYRPDEPEVIYVVGNGCEHIRGPFSWRDAKVSIVPTSTETLVVDAEAGFELRCSSAVVVRGPATDFDTSFENFLGDSPALQ